MHRENIMRKQHMLTSTAIIAIALSVGTAQAQQAAATASSPSSAAAAGTDSASSSGQVEEIVVTAQKRAENIQNVPLSIVALSGAALARANVGDAVALQKLVPSLTITSTTFVSGVTIRIRGFGTAGNTATDSDVATYLDGIFIARPGAAISTFLDVGSVEVLNGPQGTLFGRNAAMGAISINTNAPSTSRTSLETTVQAGIHNTYSAQAVANLPLSDSFALRFAGKASHNGGIYHNLFDGQDYGRNNNYIGRLSAKWNVTPDLTWTVRGDYSHTDGDGVIPAAPFTRTASAAQLTALNAFSVRYGGAVPVETSSPSFTFNQRFAGSYLTDRQWGVTSDLSYAVAPKLTLRLLDSYRDWRDAQLAQDTIATSANAVGIVNDIRSKAQSHELQFISSKGAFLDNRLGVTAGLYYFKEDFNLNTDFDLGPDFCGIAYGARAPALVPTCNAGPLRPAGYNRFPQTTHSYAAYTQLNFQILPTVEADFGARRTWDRKSANYSSTQLNPTAAAALLVVENTPLTYSNNNWSFRGSLSWQITNKVLAFATYSSGYKSGGFNSSAATANLGAANRTFNAETVRDLEVGVKSVFLDGKAQFNATFFNTTLDNFQDRSYNGLFFLTRNSGNVRSRGVDFDGQLRPIRNLSLTFSGTYLDSIYLTDVSAPPLEGCSAAAPSAACPLLLVGGVPVVPATTATQNLSGRTIGFAPKFKANGGFEFRIPIEGGYTGIFGGSGHYSSSFWTVNTLNPQSRLPGYATVDFNVGLSGPDGRWEVSVFGTNVFDKHYFVSLAPQTLGALIPGVNNPANGTTVFRGPLGDPSRYGVRLSAKF